MIKNRSDDVELQEFIIWTIQNYGSAALDSSDPGSKLKAQASHICDFVHQRNVAEEMIRENLLYLIRACRK